MKTSFRSPKARRGSLLIVAMLFSAIIGISLVSYLNLGRTGLAVSNRALYNNAAMNLAENGLEEAMYSINKMVNDSTYTWADWPDKDGTNAWRKWTGYTFDQNATGMLRVYVYNYLGSTAPKAIARATVTLGGGTSRTIEKWVEVQLRKTSKFANGLVAKQTINFNGSPQIDSWNSDPDNDGDPADRVAYSAATKNDNGSVGSISVGVSAVLVDNADIWGYVGTGGSAPKVGSTGTIGPFGTKIGTTVASHVSTDFSASFDAVSAPSTYTYTSVGALSASKTLPDDYPAATLQADGKYYITCTSIGGANNVFTIAAGKKVVLRVTDTLGNCIDIKGGSGGINVPATSRLEIYAGGNINIGGQGAMNGGTTAATMGQPINLQIYGTATSGTQNVSLSGNGVLSAVVYVPQGSITLNGSVECYGSVVGNDITLNGTSAKFHYDESLGNFGGNNPYRVSRWREITSATDRAAVASLLNF